MKQTLTCILILISLSAYGQSYVIESNFTTDKTYRITVKRAKLDSRKPWTKDLAQMTDIEAIFTQQDKNLKCVWKYGDTKAIGPEQVISHIGSDYIDLFNLYRGYEIELIFNPSTGEIKLANYEQIKQKLRDGTLKIYNNPMTKIDSSGLLLVIQQLEPTFSTPEILLSSYFPEIVLYFNLYGVSISKRFGMKSEYFYPNPFGGDPFPVIGEISIHSKNRNTLIIKNEETANQEEVNRILKEMIERISKLRDSSNQKEELPEFKLYVKSRYFYDLKQKLISKVMLEKIIEATGITQTETLEITLIE